MKTLAEFTKTTLIGGILIILPIYVAILLLLKALSGLLAAVKPIAAGIPAAVEFKQLLAIVVLVAICFITGLIVRTGPGLRAKNAFEGAVLSKLPGYTLLRGLAGRIAGTADEPTFTPALVEIEEALVPALIIEELEDGSYTVLVPSVPTPMAGACTSCQGSECIRSMCRLRRRSRSSPSGALARVSSSEPCDPRAPRHEATCPRIDHQTVRRRRLFSLDRATQHDPVDK